MKALLVLALALPVIGQTITIPNGHSPRPGRSRALAISFLP